MKESRNREYVETGGQNLVKYKIMRKKCHLKIEAMKASLSKAKSSRYSIFNRFSIPGNKKDLKKWGNVIYRSTAGKARFLRRKIGIESESRRWELSLHHNGRGHRAVPGPNVRTLEVGGSKSGRFWHSTKMKIVDPDLRTQALIRDCEEGASSLVISTGRAQELVAVVGVHCLQRAKSCLRKMAFSIFPIEGGISGLTSQVTHFCGTQSSYSIDLSSFLEISISHAQLWHQMTHFLHNIQRNCQIEKLRPSVFTLISMIPNDLVDWLFFPLLIYIWLN